MAAIKWFPHFSVRMTGWSKEASGGFLSIKDANHRLNLAEFIIHFFSCQPQPNPVIAIITGQSSMRPRSMFSPSDIIRLPGGVCLCRCLDPPLDQPACWALRKGFVPSGLPEAALVSPLTPPHFLSAADTQTERDPTPSSLFHWCLFQSATIGLGLQRRAV